MNKSFKVIALVLVAVGLLTATYKAGQSSISQDSQGDLRAKQELFELTQKDFEEYQNLKSLEDRYKKADEILGKIMTVFLADLGLRLGYKPVSAAELDAACGIPGLAAAPTIIPAGAVKSEAISTQPTSTSPSPTPTGALEKDSVVREGEAVH